jgi:molybdate transport system ATP-binding protein
MCDRGAAARRGESENRGKDSRYSRQRALPGFGVDAQRTLGAARVLVIGAGGLGSEMSPVLAAALSAELQVQRGEFRLDVALEVAPGQTLALLGPNGAGKSTALAALVGILDSSGGAVSSNIVLGGRALDAVPTEARRIGFVFQDYLLFPHLTVLDNVSFGSSRADARGWLERFGLESLASKRPSQLSGGQQQRVALARALATSPELLLLDEPLAALDAVIRPTIREELAAHLASLDIPTIVVTHDFEDVVALADAVVVIEDGAVTQRGSVRDLVREPATEYVRRLVRDWADD